MKTIRHSNPRSTATRQPILSLELERRLRLTSGLIMAVFVTLHFVNHTLGLISIDSMESMHRLHIVLWHNPIGTTVLYSSLAGHFLLALRSLYRRSTMRMPYWEAAQIASGFLIPLMLIGHIMGVRIAPWLLGFHADYPYVIGVLWSDTWFRVKQPILVVIVSLHLTIGLHFWLRLKSWYRPMVPLLLAIAIVLPVLSIFGFVRVGLDMQDILSDPAGYAEIFARRLNASAEQLERVSSITRYASWTLFLVIAATLFARWFRLWLVRRQPRFVIHHPTAGVVRGLVGQSVLEALRVARIPHASICGGRARCTSCRINIDRGSESLNPPSSLEAAALRRIGTESTVRLACQVQPATEIWITPLLPSDIGPADIQNKGGISGREQEIVALFVDLRGSSRLAETRLPYDVVLILNEFFAQMSAALDETGGHYAQFAGDGLLALYGVRGNIRQACRKALTGAIQMQQRVGYLNERFLSELNEPLRIGIGIHCGDAIVGHMGPPSARILSAIGDSINVAARLEVAAKQLDCIAVVSRVTIERAELVLQGLSFENIEIQGRQQKLAVYPVYKMGSLSELI